jgi:Fe-S cluster assembly protein SufD
MMNAMQLPTSKLERWKYSNLPAFVKGDYVEHPLSVGYEGDETYVTQNDTEMTPWACSAYGDMDLWMHAQDVLDIVIPANAENATINLSSEIEANIKAVGHIVITVETGANVTVFDNLSVEGWSVRSMSISMQKGAKMVHSREGKGQGVVTNLLQIECAEGSVYKGYALNNYGAFVRDQIHARLTGENAECYLSGAKILNDKQHCDTTILIEHMAPNCHSNQNYRNLLDGQSRGVFQGKVYVDQIAQKTDGYQLCNSILLSDKCEMDTKPELEIYADDVQCSHGATTAQLDEEPLFYLMARGIPADQARKLLIQAFLNESLEAMEEEEEIYEQLSEKITSALNA